MSIVSLFSGGLDSCLMTLLIKENNIPQQPLFINYGQLNVNKEESICKSHCNTFNLPAPKILDINEYGKIITSGITDQKKDPVSEAFLPGRNLLFLLVASAYAFQNNYDTIAMGLLKEDTAIFPDQTNDFIFSAEYTIEKTLGKKINIITPLRDFYKKNIVELAKQKGINNYYSCHLGGNKACGECISCSEYKF